jgi:hypothetical protein
MSPKFQFCLKKMEGWLREAEKELRTVKPIFFTEEVGR